MTKEQVGLFFFFIVIDTVSEFCAWEHSRISFEKSVLLLFVRYLFSIVDKNCDDNKFLCLIWIRIHVGGPDLKHSLSHKIEQNIRKMYKIYMETNVHGTVVYNPH